VLVNFEKCRWWRFQKSISFTFWNPFAGQRSNNKSALQHSLTPRISSRGNAHSKINQTPIHMKAIGRTHLQHVVSTLYAATIINHFEKGTAFTSPVRFLHVVNHPVCSNTRRQRTCPLDSNGHITRSCAN
jgi:hypothetical protein